MEDKTSDTEKKFRLVDIIGAVSLIALISVMVLGINTSIRSQKEHKENLEKSGRLVKSEAGREYELGKVEAFGHKYIAFRNGSSFGVAHSPDCPCEAMKGE